MDQTVTLADIEWSQLMAILANAQGNGVTWAVVNPLLMKVGEQLRQQSIGAQTGMLGQAGSTWNPPGDGVDPDPPPRERRVPRA